MKDFPFKRVVSFLILFCFLFSDFVLAAPSNKSFFQNRKPNYQKISEQNEALLNKKKAIHQKNSIQPQASSFKPQAELKLELASLKDISDIHIPDSLGRITEVWNSPAPSTKRIIHFQDLHTNYEAQKNSSKLIEHLYKTYGIDLVLSEGASGRIDPTKIKAFIKDRITLDLASKLLMKTGELTGEEYIALNRDFSLQLCGVEDKELYHKNLRQFNRIIKYSTDAQVFLNQVDHIITALKPLVYSKEIKALEEKEALFNDKRIEFNEYLKFLLQEAKRLNLDISIAYLNISPLQKSLELEKALKQDRIQEELKLYLTLLNQNLSQNKKDKDLEELNKKSLLFNQQKLSPVKFYVFIKNLGEKNNLSISNYKNLTNFIEYLELSSKIESYKLFTELKALSEELKYKACQNDEQKHLLTISKNLSFLKDFFNLKVSNEELEYFLNNKDTHKVGYFKEAITNLFKSQTRIEKNSNAGLGFIDYNPQIIDSHFQELEDFYKVVWERDKAIIDNSLKRMQDFKEDSAILIVGGFHTKGMTALLREQNISYIVLSANTNTDMDDKLYQDLLSGKRKPVAELIPIAKGLSTESLRLELLLGDINLALQRFGVSGLVILPQALRPGANIKDVFILKEAEGTILEVAPGEENDFYILLQISPDEIYYVYLDLSRKEIRISSKEKFEEANRAIESTTQVPEADAVTGRCVTQDTLIPVIRREEVRSWELGAGSKDKDLVNEITPSSQLLTPSSKYIPITDVKPGDYCLSLNEETQRIEPHRIKALLDMGIKPVYRLTTQSGRSIKTTINHPYLVRLGARSWELGAKAYSPNSQLPAPSLTNWLKVKDLKVGDEIGVPDLDTLNTYRIQSRQMASFSSMQKTRANIRTDEYGFKFPQFQGTSQDNSVNSSQIILNDMLIGTNDMGLFDIYNSNFSKRNISREFFYNSLKVCISYLSAIFDTIKRRDKLSQGETGNQNSIFLFLKDLDYSRAANLQMITFDHSTSIEEIEHSLTFLISYPSDFFCQTAFDFAQAFVDFLQRGGFLRQPLLGNVFTTRTYRQPLADEVLNGNLIFNYSHWFMLPLLKFNIILIFLSRFFIPNVAYAQSVLEGDILWDKVVSIEYVGYEHVYDPVRKPSASNGAGIEVEGSDILWDRIVSIEYVGYEHVYDIEVEGTHNFIGNNIFAHNTAVGGPSAQLASTKDKERTTLYSGPGFLADPLAKLLMKILPRNWIIRKDGIYMVNWEFIRTVIQRKSPTVKEAVLNKVISTLVSLFVSYNKGKTTEALKRQAYGQPDTWVREFEFSLVEAQLAALWFSIAASGVAELERPYTVKGLGLPDAPWLHVMIDAVQQVARTGKVHMNLARAIETEFQILARQEREQRLAPKLVAGLREMAAGIRDGREKGVRISSFHKDAVWRRFVGSEVPEDIKVVEELYRDGLSLVDSLLSRQPGKNMQYALSTAELLEGVAVAVETTIKKETPKQVVQQWLTEKLAQLSPETHGYVLAAKLAIAELKSCIEFIEAAGNPWDIFHQIDRVDWWMRELGLNEREAQAAAELCENSLHIVRDTIKQDDPLERQPVNLMRAVIIALEHLPDGYEKAMSAVREWQKTWSSQRYLTDEQLKKHVAQRLRELSKDTTAKFVYDEIMQRLVNLGAWLHRLSKADAEQTLQFYLIAKEMVERIHQEQGGRDVRPQLVAEWIAVAVETNNEERVRESISMPRLAEPGIDEASLRTRMAEHMRKMQLVDGIPYNALLKSPGYWAKEFGLSAAEEQVAKRLYNEAEQMVDWLVYQYLDGFIDIWEKFDLIVLYLKNRDENELRSELNRVGIRHKMRYGLRPNEMAALILFGLDGRATWRDILDAFNRAMEKATTSSEKDELIAAFNTLEAIKERFGHRTQTSSQQSGDRASHRPARTSEVVQSTALVVLGSESNESLVNKILTIDDETSEILSQAMQRLAVLIRQDPQVMDDSAINALIEKRSRRFVLVILQAIEQELGPDRAQIADSDLLLSLIEQSAIKHFVDRVTDKQKLTLFFPVQVEWAAVQKSGTTVNEHRKAVVDVLLHLLFGKWQGGIRPEPPLLPAEPPAKPTLDYLTTQNNPANSPLKDYDLKEGEGNMDVEGKKDAEEVKSYYGKDGMHTTVEVDIKGVKVNVRIANNITETKITAQAIQNMLQRQVKFLLEKGISADVIREKFSRILIVASDKLPNAALGGDCLENDLVLLSKGLSKIGDVTKDDDPARLVLADGVLYHEISKHELTGQGNEAHTPENDADDVSYILSMLSKEGITLPELIAVLTNTLSETKLFKMLHEFSKEPWLMTKEEFDKLADHGTLQGKSDEENLQAVRDGRKPIALVSSRQIYFAKQLGLTIKRLPAFSYLPDDNYTEPYGAYRQGNEDVFEHLNAVYEEAELIQQLHPSDGAPAHNPNLMLWRVNEGRALGYSEADIMAYMRRQFGHERIVRCALHHGKVIPDYILAEYHIKPPSYDERVAAAIYFGVPTEEFPWIGKAIFPAQIQSLHIQESKRDKNESKEDVYLREDVKLNSKVIGRINEKAASYANAEDKDQVTLDIEGQLEKFTVVKIGNVRFLVQNNIVDAIRRSDAEIGAILKEILAQNGKNLGVLAKDNTPYIICTVKASPRQFGNCTGDHFIYINEAFLKLEEEIFQHLKKTMPPDKEQEAKSLAKQYINTLLQLGLEHELFHEALVFEREVLDLLPDVPNQEALDRIKAMSEAEREAFMIEVEKLHKERDIRRLIEIASEQNVDLPAMLEALRGIGVIEEEFVADTLRIVESRAANTAAAASVTELVDKVILFDGRKIFDKEKNIDRVKEFAKLYYNKKREGYIFVIIAENAAHMGSLEAKLIDQGLAPDSDDLKVGVLEELALRDYNVMLGDAEFLDGFEVIRGTKLDESHRSLREAVTNI